MIGFGPICWIRLIWLASHYCIIGPGSQPADAVSVPKKPEKKRTKEHMSKLKMNDRQSKLIMKVMGF